MARMGLVLGAWLHDLDPFALRLWGNVGLRWYGLSYVAGFAAAWLILGRLAARGRLLFSAHAVGDLILGVVVGTVVGGRVGYAVFYRPELLWTFTDAPPFWSLLALNEGGMASHGGMIGVALACAWFARANRLPILHVTDALSLVAPIGIALGRLANFVNGELLGRIVAPPGAPAPWWSVKFPQELLEGHAPALSDEQVSRLERAVVPYVVDAQAPLDDAVRRMIVDLQSGNAALASELAPLISARAPSQLLQGLAEGVLVLAVLWAVWARPRRAGVVTAWFLIVYGIGRVLTEFVRLPDAHLGSWQRVGGLSRGQWLSVLMVVVGSVLLWRAARSGSARIGGWRGPAPETEPSPGTTSSGR